MGKVPHLSSCCVLTRYCEVIRFESGVTLAVLEWNGAAQLWDLRQIREQLAELNLDWEQPLFPPASGQARLKPLSATIGL